MKKTLKITGITLLILVVLLIVTPFLFKSQIKTLVKNMINENLNAKIEFSDVNLSLLSSFPKAKVSINDLEIINYEPFENETLANIKTIDFTVSIKELFKNTNEEPIIINTIKIKEALLVLTNDKFGNTNYDIAKKSDTEIKDDSRKGSEFSLDIEDYSIVNSALTYLDKASNTIIHITELNHSGHGEFSVETSELDTHTDANVSFTIDSTDYLNNNPIKLDALIGLDLKNHKYTFKENKGFINQLPLHFDGYIQQNEDGQMLDITFENPESSFKDFLAVIPEVYSKNLDNVETAGDFKLKGIIKGMSTEDIIPHLDIHITSNNASFKYPDLPKRVDNISINTSILNTTGNVDDTYVSIKKLDFKIDEDVFKSSATLRNLTKNTLVDANLDGTLNLGNITKAYPIELDKELSGILKGKITSHFDMKAIENNAYDRIQTNGNIEITDFIFSSEDIINPIHISKANVNFKPKTISLNTFEAKTGESDFSVTGNINNLLGFLLSDKDLQGNFNLTSNNFTLSDFMIEDTSISEDNKTTSDSESLKIPAFLDCNITADIKNVIYDNLNLKNVKGTLSIKDQKANLKNLTSDIFDGELAINGSVSTQTEVPVFDLKLGANDFDIAKSFEGLKLLQAIAPIAKALNGKLNTDLIITGDLSSDFTPNLSSVSGNSIAELVTSTVNPLNTEVLKQLSGAMNFIDFEKLQLKDLKTQLAFDNGKVNVKPFNLKYKGIDIQVSGSHGFDTSLDYNIVFDVPAKYLGNEVNKVIERINNHEVNTMTIPVTTHLTGSYTKPNVKTDLASAVSNLTKQLIEIEKQKLLNKGKGKVNDLIDGLLKNNKKNSDSSKTTKDSVKDIKKTLNNLLGGKQKKKDSVN